MRCKGILLGLLFATACFSSPDGVMAGATHPPGVPDLTDPAVLGSFLPLGMGQLGGDPDFPVIFLGNTSGDLPRFMLVILDARNGKNTWSVQEDAAIFFLLLADSDTIQQAYLDKGFAASGKASGEFMATGMEGLERLLVQLREGHNRSRRLTPAAWSGPWPAIIREPVRE
jgi:hypothetical protein